MKKTILLLSSILLISLNATAQEKSPSVKIFSNFNYDMSTEEGENAFKEFEIKRSYLGYTYKIDDHFLTKIIFDVGSNSAGSSYTAFLKIASLKWKTSEKITLNLGMVGTKNFKFMETAWGRRYIEKSAQDKYRWASAADAGITADYKISKNITLDAQILNGEGYKKHQSANGLFRGGFGITYALSNNLKIRLHQDFSPRSSYDDMSASQIITTAAIAYSTENMNIGAEIDIMENIDNIKDHEQEMMSFYADYKISNHYTIFVRHDNLSQATEKRLYTIYGVERKIAKGVTISLNVQSSEDSNQEEANEHTLFLNLEYKF